MVESSSPDITPKEEPVTLDRPESPNLFLPTTQVEFTFDEITFTTNNEVALIYPSLPNQEYFMAVSDFISKCCLKEAFTRSPNQYKEYLSGFWYTAKDLIHKLKKKTRENIVPYPRFISLLHEHMEPKYDNEELTINPTQIFSVHNWILKPNQPEEPPFTDHMKAICNLDVHVDSKVPKYSSPTEEVPQGKNPGARSGLRRKQSSKHTSESTTKASKSQSGHSKKEIKSSSAMDTSPSHPSPPIPVVGEMYKEAQQAAGGPTSLRDTRDCQGVLEGATVARELGEMYSGGVVLVVMKFGGLPVSVPHFVICVCMDGPLVTDGVRVKVVMANNSLGRIRLFANKESGADDISRKVKLDDLSDILKDTRSTFFTPDSPTDKPIIVSDESEEEENAENNKNTKDTLVPPPSPKSAQIQELMAQVHLLQSQKDELEQAKVKTKAEVASMKAKPSYLDINQLTELLVTSLKPELSKLLASHNFASCLPTELKELPSKITGLSGEIKELKQHIKDMEIELPGDLKEILSKLEIFTSTISSLSSQVAELKNIQWELLAEFATLVGNASGATAMGVPLADKATASPAEGEKDVDTNLKNELVDLLGIDIVTQYYNKKLLYEKYYKKMKKIRQSSKLINCDVLTKKGPISLKVVQACPDRKEKGWKTIYELIKTRMEYLKQTKKELHIDFNKSLQEQDPLDELNDLANKKRKRTCDSTDHSSNVMKVETNSYQFMLFKIYQLFTQAEVVQFEMLKFLQHQLFRSLEDWEVSSLQCMQRRFTRREKDCFMPKGIKQSPLEKVLLKSAEKYIRFSSKDCTWLNLSSKEITPQLSFNHLAIPQESSLLLAEIDKRNLNPLKHMGVIEKLRQYNFELLKLLQRQLFRTFSSLMLAEIDMRNLNPLKQMRAIEQLRQ
ncbi:hypothetical protein Tco_0863895 [Tanacetum coccineum]